MRGARLLLEPHRLQAQEVVEERGSGLLGRLHLSSIGDFDVDVVDVKSVGRVRRGDGDRRVPRGGERGLSPAAEASASVLEECRRGGRGRGEAHFGRGFFCFRVSGQFQETEWRLSFWFLDLLPFFFLLSSLSRALSAAQPLSVLLSSAFSLSGNIAPTMRKSGPPPPGQRSIAAFFGARPAVAAAAAGGGAAAETKVCVCFAFPRWAF